MTIVDHNGNNVLFYAVNALQCDILDELLVVDLSRRAGLVFAANRSARTALDAARQLLDELRARNVCVGKSSVFFVFLLFYYCHPLFLSKFAKNCSLSTLDF